MPSAPLGINYLPGKHHSREMEAAIIGACLNEPGAFSRIYPLVTEESFYNRAIRSVFSLMLRMFQEGAAIDILTVAAQIQLQGIEIENEPTPLYFLTILSRDVVSSAHLEEHCAYLREYQANRLMLEIQMNANSSLAGDDTHTRATQIQKQLQDVLSVKATDDWVDISTVMYRLGKHMDEVRGSEMMGIPYGFRTIDRITYGAQPGQLIVIGARPSVGKTAYIAKIALNMASSGAPVGVIQLEMPDIQVGARIVSVHSQIQFWRIWRSNLADNFQADTLYQSMSDIGNLPIQISDKTNVSVPDIRAKAIKLKNRGQLGCLIIDYLQLVDEDGKSGNREQAVAKMSRGLKLLAMELGIPVIVLVQLNRESDKSADKMPRMSNIRESGAIEQDADVVMLLHRAWKAGILVDEAGNSTERQAHIIIEKNRNGETGAFPISFDPETMTFYE